MKKSDLMLMINERLVELAALPQNWNDDGADRIDSEVIAQARKFFEDLDYVFPKPYIFPTPSGGIQVEWDECKENRLLTVDFMRMGVILFSLRGEFDLEKPNRIRELRDWING